LHSEKCEFDKQQIKYLGLVISEDQVEMNPVKVAGICDWPTLWSRMDMVEGLFTAFWISSVLFLMSLKATVSRFGVLSNSALSIHSRWLSFLLLLLPLLTL